MSPSQLPLNLQYRATADLGDFIVSSSNQNAADIVDRWPAWPGQIRGLNITGATGAGKTHLASVWQGMSGAKILSHLNDDVMVDTIDHSVFVLDNVAPGPDWPEEVLFLLLNRVKDGNGGVLITSQIPVSQMDWSLDDLRSRLRAITQIEISVPDDDLLLALLEKYFAERQLAVPENVLQYLTARMERSFTAVEAIVTALDQRSLAGKSQINLGLAREILTEETETER